MRMNMFSLVMINLLLYFSLPIKKKKKITLFFSWLFELEVFIFKCY